MWHTSLILISLLHPGWCYYASSCQEGTCSAGMVCIDNSCKCDETTHEIYIHYDDRNHSSLATCREKRSCVDAEDCKQGVCEKMEDSSDRRCICPEGEILIKEKTGEVNGCWKNLRKNVSELCSSIGVNCDMDKRLLCYDGQCRCHRDEVFFNKRCITVKEYKEATGEDGYYALEHMYCTSEFECVSDMQSNLTCSSNFCVRDSAASSVSSVYLFGILVSIGLTSCISHILVF